MGIKHILQEDNVEQIFKLIVPDGDYSGEYIMKTPDGWNEVDSIVDINDEFFNIENFIIGDTTKLSISGFSDPNTYTLIKNLYRESGGDARAIFKWIASKDGVEYDLLSENFEINFNKYNDSLSNFKGNIEVEIIKRESQNKLYTREDTTVNLFETKDLDDNDIVPVPTFSMGYKKGGSTRNNFYTFDLSQRAGTANNYPANSYQNAHFYAFIRADDYEFGINTNSAAGENNKEAGTPIIDDLGPFVTTDIPLAKIEIQISNLEFMTRRAGAGEFPDVALYAVIKNGATETRTELLQASVPIADSNLGITWGQIKIESQKFTLSQGLNPNDSLTFQVRTRQDRQFIMYSLNENASIKLTTNQESPIVKTTGLRLISAINQLAKLYTSSEITAESNILGPGGDFYNSSISTGIYLRGLPSVYNSQKIKTSMKSLLQDGASKLLSLGYDVLGNKLIVEDIGYFFKDYKTYDLSEKQYLREDFKIGHDEDVSYNNLIFGSKKYSTEFKFDIKNFNTYIEANTPIISKKNKFDRQTDFIIDPYRIQELIEDKSTSTNENDDDLVLIDMVEVENFWDTGIFKDCSHTIEGGNLMLECYTTPFDTTLIEVGSLVEITDGINAGPWTALEINMSKLRLGGSGTITTGKNDCRIKYRVEGLLKNRTIEGFTGYQDTIFDPESTTNIRHNPKYQMARWWSLFGSGLRKKKNTESIKITNYKNNSEAKVNISEGMLNEIQGEIIVGGNETLERMRKFKPTFFNGEDIEIVYSKITFEEFFDIYSNWKFGESNDRLKSRGFISCNTPEGIYDVYPFGSGAFSHNKTENTLTIKGKVKGKSVENPILLSVIQINKNTITLTWDYVIDYVNPIVDIQYSLDGINWITIHTVNNVKTATFSNSVFEEILTGTNVYFRIIASTSDYYNKVSNSLITVWQFNNWIIREISRSENVNCGFSFLTFVIVGNLEAEITWIYSDEPGGGLFTASDVAMAETLAFYESPPGFVGNTDEQTTTHTIVGMKTISIILKNTESFEYIGGLRPLNCTSGNYTTTVSASLFISIKDTSTDEIVEKALNVITQKKYFYRPPNPGGGIEIP